MHPNLLVVPTFLGALLFGLLGFRVISFVRSSFALVICFTLAAVLAVPALLFVAYYAHILDGAGWFYSFRAAPFTELTASSLGFGVGLVLGMLKRSSVSLRLTAPVSILFCGAVLLVPYLKPIVAPIQVPLQTRWKDGVALQSTPSTCGPCSAATILRMFNIPVSERELALECFSYGGGTENWYVARALQRRGLQTRYIVSLPQDARLPMPSIAGVQLGGPDVGGHFITLLGRSGDKFIVGDPLVGKLILTSKQLHSRYYFTGFFLRVSKPEA